MKTRCHGFTMMELMAVVAVVAILAMLALPSYLERIVRDQIKYKEYSWPAMSMYGGGPSSHHNAAYYDGDQTVQDQSLDFDTKKDGSSATREQVKANYSAYKERKMTELTTQLSYPVTIYGQWEKLLAEPISKSLMQNPFGN